MLPPSSFSFKLIVLNCYPYVKYGIFVPFVSSNSSEIALIRSHLTFRHHTTCSSTPTDKAPPTSLSTGIMTSDKNLTIVLLCSGNGAEPSIYRPSRDDVRYRQRQDALVRCVAASLYGPAIATNDSICELILLYDEDLSCMRMKLSNGSLPKSTEEIPPPLEADIVASWKEAAKAAIRSKQCNQQSTSSIGALNLDIKTSTSENTKAGPRFTTTCELDLWKKIDPTNSTTKDRVRLVTTDCPNNPVLKKLPSIMPSSKRDALVMLQATCPMEYLRRHHLNVALDLALRKINKSKLQSAWEGYTKFCTETQLLTIKTTSKQANNATIDISCDNDKYDKIERTFRCILSEAKPNDHLRSGKLQKKIIAACLHESCDAELPCWGWDRRSRNEHVGHIFLFLGAVRDMTISENKALSIACKSIGCPLVPCRLGPVPEFTSKIVSVAAFHHSKGVLGYGLSELWRRSARQDTKLTIKRRKIDTDLSNGRPCRTIHSIVIVPMISASLSVDPSKRNRIHWCMVRMVVCALWRSKLTSKPDSNGHIIPLNNLLTFLFLDGMTITLKQKDFTKAMAENHKAAPSELQILEQLCRQRDAASPRCGATSTCDQKNAIKGACRDLVNSFASRSGWKQFVLSMGHHKRAASNKPNLFDMAYSDEYCQNNSTVEYPYTLLTIQKINSSVILSDQSDNRDIKQTAEKRADEAHKYLMRAFKAADIFTMIHPRLMNSFSCQFQEEETNTIIMLQHLDYQQRLFSLLLEYEKKNS